MSGGLLFFFFVCLGLFVYLGSLFVCLLLGFLSVVVCLFFLFGFILVGWLVDLGGKVFRDFLF